MKIEKLRNNHKKEIIIGTILTVVIGGALTFRLTHSKYRVTQSIDLGSGVINYKVPDFKIIAMYKNDGSGDVSIDSMPSSGYIINEEKTYCTSDGTNQVKGKLYTNNLGEHVFKNLNKGDKCYIWFDVKRTTIDDIIATIKASSSYKWSTIPTFSSVATGAETETNNGIYATSDGTNMYSGTTYYWRGAATTNYVKFAGYCWRIIRINGDKTMRLIYDGTTCHANGTNTSESIAVTNQAYNSSYNQSNYVGWTYTGSSQRTLSGSNSNAKAQTESWYNNNIGNNSIYAAKVADGKFCNDRDAGYSWSLKPSSPFNYAGQIRINNNSPTFNCPKDDVYTLKVGAITSDEVIYAGGRADNNISYYLYNGQDYWTMSPSYWDGNYVGLFYVYSVGFLGWGYVNNSSRGLRPVINLKADTTFSSNSLGTKDSPYVVQ